MTSKLQKRLRKEDPEVREKYNAYQREYRKRNLEKIRKLNNNSHKRIKEGYWRWG